MAAGDVHMHLRLAQAGPRRGCCDQARKNGSRVRLRVASNAEQICARACGWRNCMRRSGWNETLKIAARCQFSLNELRYEYPKRSCLLVNRDQPSACTDRGRRTRSFRKGAARGAREIEKELALVAELRYEAFFLTIEDVVRFARSQGILCQGRGSAANSVVCYCLRITEVDPRRCNVLFERFISRERNEPPDIDVDFEHQRREEFIQYIYSNYGRGPRGTRRHRPSANRSRACCVMSARRLGFDPQRIDRWQRTTSCDSGQRHSKGMIEAGFDPDSFAIRQWLTIAQRSARLFPRHLSQHVGGFVIGGTQVVAVGADRKLRDGRSSLRLQWDKDDLESLGPSEGRRARVGQAVGYTPRA